MCARAFLQRPAACRFAEAHLAVQLLSDCDLSRTLIMMPPRAFSTRGNALLQVCGAARASVHCSAAARACLPPSECRFGPQASLLPARAQCELRIQIW